jgi:hypothetical protein
VFLTLLQKREGELSESLLSQENTLAVKETEHEARVTVLEGELKQVASDKMKLQHRLQEAHNKEGIIKESSVFCIRNYNILSCLT